MLEHAKEHKSTYTTCGRKESGREGVFKIPGLSLAESAVFCSPWWSSSDFSPDEQYALEQFARTHGFGEVYKERHRHLPAQKATGGDTRPSRKRLHASSSATSCPERHEHPEKRARVRARSQHNVARLRSPSTTESVPGQRSDVIIAHPSSAEL